MMSIHFSRYSRIWELRIMGFPNDVNLVFWYFFLKFYGFSGDTRPCKKWNAYISGHWKLPLVANKTQKQAARSSKRCTINQAQSNVEDSAGSKVLQNQLMGMTSKSMTQSEGMKQLLQTNSHPWVDCMWKR